MIFINQEQIALLESKFHFQIEDWSLPTVESFEITNVDWVVTYVNQKFTREIRNRWWLLVSVGLTLWGIFLKFSGTFLVHLQHACFYEIILHIFITADYFFTSRIKVLAINILLSEHRSGQTRLAANSLLLVHEHSPDVNNKPISIPYLEQGYRWNITIFNLKVEFWFQ